MAFCYRSEANVSAQHTHRSNMQNAHQMGSLVSGHFRSLSCRLSLVFSPNVQCMHICINCKSKY